MKVTLDTSILLSAFIFPGGPPEKIVGRARLGEIQVFLSPDILTEFQNVLRKKFRYSDLECDDFVDRVIAFAHLVYPVARIRLIKRVDADNRILECAREAEVDFIVTGDKRDILPLKKFEGIPILTPAAFLEILDRKKKR